MVGKLRSLALMIVSLVLGLVAQYWWASYAAENLSAWGKNCSGNETCIGNSAIYRCVTSSIDVAHCIRKVQVLQRCVADVWCNAIAMTV